MAVGYARQGAKTGPKIPHTEVKDTSSLKAVLKGYKGVFRELRRDIEHFQAEMEEVLATVTPMTGGHLGEVSYRWRKWRARKVCRHLGYLARLCMLIVAGFERFFAAYCAEYAPEMHPAKQARPHHAFNPRT